MTAATASSIDEIADLFEGEAMGLPYGEVISIRDHMLQCAERALLQRCSGPIVAAALLHDIGWVLGAPHEATAADWLEPLLGKAVADPIRHHVSAKRYLVTRDQDYVRLLSGESVRTLALQGGAMSIEECEAFERLACHKDAIALRLIDDAGKRLSAPDSRFADYRRLLEMLRN